MKRCRQIIVILYLFSPQILQGCVEKAQPYFSIRSQSVDAARELSGWANDFHINLYDMCGLYGSFSLTPEYTQSRKPDRIARCLFGDSLNPLQSQCAQITISGSHVPNRSSRDWLADYFILPPDYQSVVTFEPNVNWYLVDPDFYLGLDEFLEGFYFRIHGPIVHTRWKLNAQERIIDPGSEGYEAGYFTPEAIPRNQLAVTIFEALNGCEKILEEVEPLKFSRWSQKGLTTTKLSDVQIALGWNFFQDEDFHIGANVRGSIPTGTRPDGIFLFEPVVGNGHHWELGLGITSHVTVWRDLECDRSIGLYCDGNFTHLFNTCQGRGFDLCNSPSSRYMLAANLSTPVRNGLQGGITDAALQFTGDYTYVANLTTTNIKISSALQVDIAALINYTHGGVTFDLGYNLWVRTIDDISFNAGCPTTLERNRTWTLKGDAHMYGFPLDPMANPNNPTDAIALSSTESAATIFAGTNRPCNTPLNSTEQSRNPDIDNPQPATAIPNNGTERVILVAQNQTDPNDQINTSIQSVLLIQQMIDVGSMQTKGLSNSLFAHLAYTWFECDRWMPYLGAGTKMEWASYKGSVQCPTSDCISASSLCTVTGCDITELRCGHKRCSLTTWNVWLKGGVSFN